MEHIERVTERSAKRAAKRRIERVERAAERAAKRAAKRRVKNAERANERDAKLRIGEAGRIENAERAPAE